MKKPIAILLLAIYLFNLVGYAFVFGYFMQQSDRRFVEQLNRNNYREAELSTISIPLHLPYIQNSGGFERVDGSVEYKGVHYNYVKRMVQNDTLYIQVLANYQKTQLVKDRADYAGAVNDFAAGKKEKEPVAKKISFTTEYNNGIPRYDFEMPVAIISQKMYGLSFRLNTTYIDTPGHPPQKAC